MDSGRGTKSYDYIMTPSFELDGPTCPNNIGPQLLAIKCKQMAEQMTQDMLDWFEADFRRLHNLPTREQEFSNFIRDAHLHA